MTEKPTDADAAVSANSLWGGRFTRGPAEIMRRINASIEFDNGRWILMDDAGFAASPMAGGIFAIEVGVRGLPEPAFRIER